MNALLQPPSRGWGRAEESTQHGSGGGNIPRIGLVLSSGGARGLAHAGVIQVLEENQIPITAIAGCSMGAYVGSLWAAGLNGAQLEERAAEIKDREALKALLSRRHEVFAIHLMDPEEVDPKYGGHLKLIDSETGEEVEVTLNAKLREVYKKKVAAYVSSLQDYCSSRGIYYLSTRTDFEIERLVLDYLRRVGFVR